MDAEIILAIMAISAVAISIISMIFTVLFSIQQMKHNRNSVRPICEINLSDYEDKIAVYISNVGTGPLTIKNITCSDTERSSPMLLSLMPHIDQLWTTFTENITGWTIPVGGRIALIELKPQSDELKFTVRNALKDITIYVEYADIYNKLFYKDRKLDFFGRTLINSEPKNLIMSKSLKENQKNKKMYRESQKGLN